MLTVRLPRGPATSALGFGCAYLTGGLESRRSVALVRAAMEAGITHFDSAPPYGIGTAEDVLGVALKGLRAQATVASKIGLPRPRLSLAMQLARTASAPLRRAAGPLLRRLRSSLPDAVRPPLPNPLLSPGAAQLSLTDSLRRIGTDYVDLLLLHDARPEDITDELLTFLDKRRSAGSIRAIGVSSDPGTALRIAARYPSIFDAAQFSWSPLADGREPPVESGSLFKVTHRTLMYAMQPISGWLRSDPAAASRLSSAAGADLSEPTALARMLLACAIANNLGGIVLVGSRSKRRIALNAAAAEETSVSAGRAFLAQLSREAGVPPAA